MNKINTIFVRNEKNMSRVIDVWHPSETWVRDGEGRATIKYDGTACAFIGGVWYKRNEWDANKGLPPASWRHWSGDPNQRSGHGWIPVGDDPGDWMHRKAIARGTDDIGEPFREGTYELIGPGIQRNPHNKQENVMVPHGRDETSCDDRTYDGIRNHLAGAIAEGIVFHHPDGRMAKIKRRDFGIAWPAKEGEA